MREIFENLTRKLLMLPEKLAQDFQNTREHLITEDVLPTLDQLNSYYATFHEKFGPDVLRKLDGEQLLTTLHSNSRDSLVYWLEFKDDYEFPAIFGSIAGGSALKFGVYQSAKTGAWMSRDPSNFPVEISLDKAIKIAHSHRDQLLHGIALLEGLPSNGSNSDYQTLQQHMDRQAPDVSNLAWGHKYFSLIFPDKLDDYHSAYYQRFHLVKSLQPSIPEERAGRYIAAGRFLALARELDMPMNHLTTVFNKHNGRPYRYWAIHTSDQTVNWNVQRDGGFAAILWSDLGDLSSLKHDSHSKKLLYERIEQFYPRASNSERQAVFGFVTDIAVGDCIVAFEPRGRKVMGVGRVKGDYYFEISSASPHRRSVQWYSTDTWQFPADEGFDRGVREILAYANQVEIERSLLDAPIVEHKPPQIVAPSALRDKTEFLEADVIPKIFISYRHRSWAFAYRLADELTQRLKANIFVDYKGIDKAEFEVSILHHLRESDAVLLVISEYTFTDRIHNDDDWVRREIREALITKKPLILVSVDGLLPPANLPNDIKDVSRMQAVNFYPEYFGSGVERLADFVGKILVADDQPPAIDHSTSHLAMLDEAVELMERGDFHKATALLEKLRSSGYQSRYVNIEALLNQAQVESGVWQAAQRDYEEIALLASRKFTLGQAKIAFALWCKDYPSLVETLDTQNLRKRFNTQ